MAPHPEADLYRCSRCTHCFSQLQSSEFEPYDPDYFNKTHKRWFTHPNIALFERVAKKIPQGASVLDVGCGRGDLLRYLRKIRPDLVLTGVDLSANQDSDGIKFYQKDIFAWDVQEQYDAVVSLAVIEHVKDIRSFSGRLGRLTKPGGTVAVMTLNNDSLLYILARLGNSMGVPLAFNRLYSRHHLHHFTRKSLRTVLETCGLAIETEAVHGAPLAALDIPVSNRAAEIILRACVWGVGVAGAMTGRSYLQTIFCKKPA